MEKLDWRDCLEDIEKVNCAYHALVSVLSCLNKELSDEERFGLFIINSYIFDSLKSTLSRINKLHKQCEEDE